jgi:hypothetical protein
MQLRLLQTVSEVASDQNSTLVMPLPMEVLRFFEQASGGAVGATSVDAPSAPAPVASPAPLEVAPAEVPPVAVPPVDPDRTNGDGGRVAADSPEVGR